MVGGHIDSGEEEYTALIREISEEAGITASDEKIDFIGQIAENIVEDTFIDNEICKVYRYTPDFDEKFNPNKEVGRIVRIEEKEYKKCIFGVSETAVGEVISVSNQNHMEVKSPGDKIEIRKDDFCEYDLKYIKFVTGMDDDEFFMWEALAEAKKAYDKEETPIGAVIVKDAGNTLGGWRLFGCTLYVTMEPCIMCCGAIVNSRIRNVVIGAKKVKNAKIEKQSDFKKEYFEDSKVEYKYGVLEEECAGMLGSFFKRLR